MKFGLLSLLIALFSSSAWSANLADDPQFSYEVLFTNPICANYVYPSEVRSMAGNILTQKPKDVYCTKQDGEASGHRANSPQQRLVDWVSNPSTHEIFMAFLSFSDQRLLGEICNAIQTRNVKVKMVLDAGTSLTAANKLLECKPLSGLDTDKPEILLRGGVSGIKLAHIKMLLINPSDAEKFQVAFGSGNLSSGTVLHHENWNFITASKTAFFAQTHLCVMNGMIAHATKAADFREFMTSCRAAITSPEEDDIHAYFVPADGVQATKFVLDSVAASDYIQMAVHRFSMTKLMDAMKVKLAAGTLKVDFVSDDDIYWSGITNHNTGENTISEFVNVKALTDVGMDARYMQTNQNEMLLHHNKYLIFDHAANGQPAVFTGAGNISNAAFSGNFENFYSVQIPSVVAAFQAQYAHVWNDLATDEPDMPANFVKPMRQEP